jgi:hypothetical protein
MDAIIWTGDARFHTMDLDKLLFRNLNCNIRKVRFYLADNALILQEVVNTLKLKKKQCIQLRGFAMYVSIQWK